MKIILRTDIENVGKLGEIVDVKPGFARNYLIPKQLAMLATDSNLKLFEQQRRQLQEKLDQARFAAMDLAQKLEQVTLEIEVRVGENDKLYGSVTSAQIAEGLSELGFAIDRKKIELDQPIRSLGEYEVGVRVYPEVCPKIKVVVKRHADQDAGQEE